MNPAGSLAISARLDGSVLADLQVRLERPVVTRLFIGQLPEAVVKAVPYLYALCAQAQRAAAQAALAAAAGATPRPAADAELWTEALHEHLWRLLLDWPAALGLPPEREAFAAWRASRGSERFTQATAELLAATLEGEWAEACLSRLPGGDCPQAPAPASLTPDAWLAHWRGERAEAPAPMRPNSVASAWRARRTEALLAAEALADGRPYPVAAAGGEGWGVGQTLTARGVLTHAVRLEAGRVAAYRVWAPTDVHFADAEGLARLLAQGRWDNIDSARQAVEQAVLALDPCLPFNVKIENA